MTSAKSSDRRPGRTRAQLHRALLDLLAEKLYPELTVEEIAARANVARKTFYAHYADKHDLLWGAMEGIFEQLKESFGALDPDSLLMQGKPLTYPLFKHVEAYAPLYRVMLSEEGASSFLLRLLAYVTQASYEKHAPLRAAARQITVDPHYTAHFLAGAAVNVLIWWLQNDLQPPAETMAYTFSQLAAPGVLFALGLDA